MEVFNLNSEYIELCNLLKIAGPRFSGGEAKFVISQGLVTVDDNIELRKKCKIRAGQNIKFEAYGIQVK